MRFPTTFLTLLLLLTVSAAHAQIETTDTLLPTTAEERANAFYLEGLRQQLNGNHDDAYELFCHALDLNPQLVGALYELSGYTHYMRDDSLAFEQLKQAADIDSDNYYLKQALVSSYLSQNRQDEAIQELEQMARQYPDKSSVLLTLVQMYGQKEDYKSMISALDRVELLEGKSEQLSLQKFRAYVQMKDEKRAFAEMRSLAEEYPNDVRYRVLIGDLYLDNGKLSEAKNTYDEIGRDHPDNVNLQLSLARYYQRTDNDSLYRQALERLVLNEQLDDDTRVQLVQGITMQSVQQNGDTAVLMPLFRQLLTLPQKDTRLAELCARYMITSSAPVASVKPVLRQMLQIDPEAELARGQLLAYAIQEEDTNEIVRLCRTAVDYNSSDPVYYYYLGIASYQQGNKETALDAIRKGLTKTGQSTDLALVTNMYAISGDLYHIIGDDRHAFEAYDSCLLYRPDDALVLNNYAYYLSLQKRDLERAEEMSRRAIRQEPLNATYLDTYEWVLFQQKNYAEARIYADSVLTVLADSIQPSDANLVEHAGDVYSRLGQEQRALELWRQAEQLYLLSDDEEKAAALPRLQTKIKKRKYVE